MDEPQRSVAKRQIARLLGGAATPMYVLSEDGTLVFANEALGTILGRSAESLLGLRCSSPMVSDASDEKQLVSFLSLPVQWTRQHIRLIPVTEPTLVGAGSSWIRCLLPLDSPQLGCVLCALCPSDSGLPFDVWDEHGAIIEKTIAATRQGFAHLDGFWFLHGNDPMVKHALNQVQIAVENRAPVTIFGPKGSGRSWVAQCIHAQRNPDVSSTQRNNALIRIDCSLMDFDLFKSMLELVSESHQAMPSQTTLLLENLESLPVDCFSALLGYLKREDRSHCIATCAEECFSNAVINSSMRREILLRTATLRVDLPSLSERIEDIRVLIVAWLDQKQRERHLPVDFSNGFVAALTAYPWPNDVEEFAEAMETALRELDKDSPDASSILLTEKHLPVNIRTCVSFIEESTEDSSVDLDEILNDIEKTMILRAVERFPNNKTAAAKILNISRARLIRRLQQWGLQSQSESEEDGDELPMFEEIE